ncbi:hypothetical protein L1987_26676 [Smallanthus sonchifolius]|uniref:Uncharacterized protein n=1 Tax=Smallanthus sonchifolius TaxID=185202 RepID=A0ACB9IBI4_9ASTR|nr:hypothetical protein L1987_26676 [Smallanthus sonchifolius]
MEDDLYNYIIGSGFAALWFVLFVSGSQHPSSGSSRSVCFLISTSVCFWISASSVCFWISARNRFDLRKFRWFLDLNIRPLKEKEIIEYLEVKLSNQILHLWELSPALTAASLPPW